MVCLGLEPGSARWKVQTNPLVFSVLIIKYTRCTRISWIILTGSTLGYLSSNRGGLRKPFLHYFLNISAEKINQKSHSSLSSKMKSIGIAAVLLFASLVTQSASQFTEDDAKEFINGLDTIFCDAGNAEMVARWNYITDITPDHEEDMVHRNESTLKNNQIDTL